MYSSLKHAVSAKDGLMTYCGLLIKRIFDCLNILYYFTLLYFILNILNIFADLGEEYASSKYLPTPIIPIHTYIHNTFSESFQILINIIAIFVSHYGANGTSKYFVRHIQTASRIIPIFS